MKITRLIFALVIFAFVFTSCSSEDKPKQEDTIPNTFYEDTSVTSDALSEHKTVTLEIENYGKIVCETYSEYAPQTVKHFLELVENEVYNDFSIEKIVPGKYILTSENSSVQNNSIPTINGEFYKNGYTNNMDISKYTLVLNHIPGQYNSASAQFMIVLSDNNDYEGEYAPFAKVIDGESVLNKIICTDTDDNGKPVSPIVMKKVYINE